MANYSPKLRGIDLLSLSKDFYEVLSLSDQIEPLRGKHGTFGDSVSLSEFRQSKILKNPSEVMNISEDFSCYVPNFTPILRAIDLLGLSLSFSEILSLSDEILPLRGKHGFLDDSFQLVDKISKFEIGKGVSSLISILEEFSIPNFSPVLFALDLLLKPLQEGSDTLLISEHFSIKTSAPISLYDLVETSELFSKLSEFRRTFPESQAIGESILRAVSKYSKDLLSLEDLFEYELGRATLLYDILLMSEIFNWQTSGAVGLHDFLKLKEYFQKQIAFPLSGALTFSDYFQMKPQLKEFESIPISETDYNFVIGKGFYSAIPVWESRFYFKLPVFRPRDFLLIGEFPSKIISRSTDEIQSFLDELQLQFCKNKEDFLDFSEFRNSDLGKFIQDSLDKIFDKISFSGNINLVLRETLSLYSDLLASFQKEAIDSVFSSEQISTAISKFFLEIFQVYTSQFTKIFGKEGSLQYTLEFFTDFFSNENLEYTLAKLWEEFLSDTLSFFERPSLHNGKFLVESPIDFSEKLSIKAPRWNLYDEEIISEIFKITRGVIRSFFESLEMAEDSSLKFNSEKFESLLLEQKEFFFQVVKNHFEQQGLSDLFSSRSQLFKFDQLETQGWVNKLVGKNFFEDLLIKFESQEKFFKKNIETNLLLKELLQKIVGISKYDNIHLSEQPSIQVLKKIQDFQILSAYFSISVLKTISEIVTISSKFQSDLYRKIVRLVTLYVQRADFVALEQLRKSIIELDL